MKINWKDETSYKIGEHGVIPPNVLRTEIESVRITIHRHIHYPGTWLLTCHDLGIKMKDLYVDNLKEAEKMAIKVLLDSLAKYARLNAELLKLLNSYTF